MSWNERPWAGDDFRGGGRRFADNPLSWSLTVGRVFGIRVRLHMLFILFLLFELLGAGGAFPWVAQYLLILFTSVFLHELGHCFAARRVGGRADDVLLWPLGGLATVDAPRALWPQFVTVVCGPLVNVVLLGIAAAALQLEVSANPFAGWTPVSASWGNAGTWLRLVYQINLALFLFNLWPMYPMDGGRMLHCALWGRMGHHRSLAVTTTVGMVAAIVMGMYGVLNAQWLMIGIAILGYTSCLQERQMLAAGAYGEDYTPRGFSPDEPAGHRRPGWLARWKTRRAAARREQKVEKMRTLQEEVDRILDKVHHQGIQSLTRGERQTLEDASRLQQQSDRR